MGDFKAYFIHLALESPNIIRFHNSFPEAVSEVGAGAVEDKEVDDMVVDVVVGMVANDDLVEGDMVITHMNSPEGTENLGQKLRYNLHTNEDFFPCNKIIIIKK